MAINNSVEAMIDNIVTVVFKIHFYYINSKDLEQDLKQEGYLKAYELLAEGNYDPNKNLRNYIYTGVRNAMSNYIYHHNKENHDNLDLIYDQQWQSFENITMDAYWNHKIYCEIDDYPDDYDVDLPMIYNICKKYTMFGDYRGNILTKLKQLGIYSGLIKFQLINSVPFIEEAIVGEILWTMFK